MATGSPDESDLQQRMVAPIDGGCGADLRLDASPSSLYFRLRDARADARAAERAADDDPAGAAEQTTLWSGVGSLAIEALGTHGKDLEIAAWLAESLTRERGLPGLACGLRIIAALLDTYWAGGLFPSEDEDGPAARLSAIAGLSGVDRDGSLLQPLRKLVLFQREDGSDVQLWEYDRARALAAPGDGGNSGPRPVAGGPSFADIEATARGSGRGRLTLLGTQAGDAIEALDAMDRAIARIATGFEAPSTGRLRQLLDGIARLVARYVPQAAQVADGESPDPAEDATADDRRSRLPSAASRDQLLEQILEIAAIFRSCEPNSPLSLTLEEAVRRARLTMPELLRELMPDAPSRQQVLAQLGIRQMAE